MADALSTRLYLDHAASAPLRATARRAWLEAHDLVGNPSSRHGHGQDAAAVLGQARRAMSTLLGARGEVVFTSGGTESIVLAVLGSVGADPRGVHLVVPAIEHSAVLGAADRVASLGGRVTVVPPRSDGTTDVDRLAEAIRPDTALVCLQHANNETGVLQPVAAVAELLSDHPARLLVDAVQTAGKLPLDCVRADLLAVSAHKFGGPRGIGALRVAPDVELTPLVRGASHEGGRRAGTENVAGAAAMAAAARECLTTDLRPEHRQRMESLRGRWEEGIRSLAHPVALTSTAARLPETLSLLVTGLRGDTVASLMDLLGVSVGTGSACHARGARPSHVLTAMGLSHDEALSALRISFGPTLQEQDIDDALDALEHTLMSLRRVSGSLLSVAMT